MANHGPSCQPGGPITSTKAQISPRDPTRCIPIRLAGLIQPAANCINQPRHQGRQTGHICSISGSCTGILQMARPGAGSHAGGFFIQIDAAAKQKGRCQTEAYLQGYAHGGQFGGLSPMLNSGFARKFARISLFEPVHLQNLRPWPTRPQSHHCWLRPDSTPRW